VPMAVPSQDTYTSESVPGLNTPLPAAALAVRLGDPCLSAPQLKVVQGTFRDPVLTASLTRTTVAVGEQKITKAPVAIITVPRIY
jgi:hypothetical protein